MIHASLFSGIGGAEVAASWMGWQNAFHCEIQEYPRKALEYWFPNSISYEDITKTDFTQWGGRIDVLTGGFPCQPFSLAGRRKGEDDNRFLWPHMLRAIREIQPTWVVAENVTGILTMVQPSKAVKMGRDGSIFKENYIYRKEQRYTFGEICDSLERAGYSVQPFVIPACAVEAPHERKRVWLVAHSDINRQRKRTSEQKPIAGCSRTPDTGKGGEEGNVANAHGEMLERQEKRESDTGIWRGIARHDGAAHWHEFPTQSPVCRRDDGLPFDVDDLTVSFATWRRESIKAYGNAWVPQVAYEIFKAIEMAEGGG